MFNKKTLTIALVAALSCASLSVNAGKGEYIPANGKGEFSFALIGDVPYGVAPGEYYQPYEDLVGEINDDSRIKWVLHAGDIKSGLNI
jgi:hypothetical protein